LENKHKRNNRKIQRITEVQIGQLEPWTFDIKNKQDLQHLNSVNNKKIQDFKVACKIWYQAMLTNNKTLALICALVIHNYEKDQAEAKKKHDTKDGKDEAKDKDEDKGQGQGQGQGQDEDDDDVRLVKESSKYNTSQKQSDVTKTSYEYTWNAQEEKEEGNYCLISAVNNAIGKKVITPKSLKEFWEKQVTKEPTRWNDLWQTENGKTSQIGIAVAAGYLESHPQNNNGLWLLQSTPSAPIKKVIESNRNQKRFIVHEKQVGIDHFFAIIRYRNQFYKKDDRVEKGKPLPLTDRDWPYATQEDYNKANKRNNEQTWYELKFIIPEKRHSSRLASVVGTK
jgi:hypothetical protein